VDFLSNWVRDLGGSGWKIILATVVDIAIVSFAIYKLMALARRTRAWQIAWGLVVFLVFVYVTERLQLRTINWLLQSLLPLGPVAIVILFYPELRHALEEMGRLAGWKRGFMVLGKEDISGIISEICTAVDRMSKQKVGALIVLERDTGLSDIARTGTRLNASVSAELLGTIFHPGSPLHDGAVIISGNRIIAASCTLPLSESAQIGTMIHTRHKAAVGVTEESDAAVVVVSEETGTISLSLEGRLHQGLDEATLTDWLKSVYGVEEGDERKFDLAKTVGDTLRKARFKG
jgi:diadenylate cyclase